MGAFGIRHIAGSTGKGLEEGRADRIQFELSQLFAVALDEAKIESERGKKVRLAALPRLDGCTESSEVVFGLLALEDRVGRHALVERLETILTQAMRGLGAVNDRRGCEADAAAKSEGPAAARDELRVVLGGMVGCFRSGWQRQRQIIIRATSERCGGLKGYEPVCLAGLGGQLFVYAFLYHILRAGGSCGQISSHHSHKMTHRMRYGHVWSSKHVQNGFTVKLVEVGMCGQNERPCMMF
jgi:hypothetical protein